MSKKNGFKKKNSYDLKSKFMKKNQPSKCHWRRFRWNFRVHSQIQRFRKQSPVLSRVPLSRWPRCCTALLLSWLFIGRYKTPPSNSPTNRNEHDILFCLAYSSTRGRPVFTFHVRAKRWFSSLRGYVIPQVKGLYMSNTYIYIFIYRNRHVEISISFPLSSVVGSNERRPVK